VPAEQAVQPLMPLTHCCASGPTHRIAPGVHASVQVSLQACSGPQASELHTVQPTTASKPHMWAVPSLPQWVARAVHASLQHVAVLSAVVLNIAANWALFLAG
jgi:hypothetical protein